MLLYLFIFLIPVVWYYSTIDDDEQSKKTLGIYIGCLALFVGLSDMFGGYDRYIYGEVFDQLSQVIRADGDVLQTAGYRLYSSEWGYLAFNHLMSYITVNRYIFIFTLTILIYTALFISIKQYCENYPFAVILFLGLWFFFTFTYLRQVSAATIGWLAIRYAIDRKPIPFFFIVLLAYSFHNSAIILAPLYFIPQKVFPKGVVLVVLTVCFIVGLTNALGGIMGGADEFMQDQRMATMVDEEGSFRIAYFLEALFFFAFIFLNYNLFDESDRRQTLLLNMAIIFCALLLLFVRSENGGRIAWIYMIGIIATVSSIIQRTDKQQLFSTAMIALMLFLYLRIFNAWQHYNNLYPYKTFLTNGHRTPDYTYEWYEYDKRYDEDKFYKLW
ncbi:MAG: EpsG family protein [Muribaculaceae bacterium]|nr:EpsG family protein [Muribaculaceae bacterium]